MYWDKHFEKGSDWYEKFFDNERQDQLRGEIAPTLFPSEAARSRIRENVGEVRIIILLRDPVERSISHYRHERALGLQRGSLEQAVKADPRILEASRYSKYIPRWIADFGEEHVFLIQQSAIAEEPEQVLVDICNFLGINPEFRFQDIASRSSQGARARSPLLTRLFYQAASRLRSLHCHWLVNLGNKLGLRQVLYSKQKEVVTDADRAFLEQELKAEIGNWKAETDEKRKD